MSSGTAQCETLCSLFRPLGFNLSLPALATRLYASYIKGRLVRTKIAGISPSELRAASSRAPRAEKEIRYCKICKIPQKLFYFKKK